MLHFNENVGGLSRGAPVLFKGIPVGQVLDVTLEFDSANRAFRIPVAGRDRTRTLPVERRHPHGRRLPQAARRLRPARDAGAAGDRQLPHRPAGGRVRLLPERQAGQASTGAGPHPELPTIPGQLEQVGDRVSQIVTRMEKIPIEQIAGNLRDTLEGTKRVANSPEILKTIKSLDAAIQELQAFTHELRTRTSPELVAAMQQARTSLASASSALESDSPLQSRMKAALEEITSAARSLRVLADYLERYPQSLLVGKDAPK
ncbi:MAG: MlaD family protein [Rhodopseudomonas palustris]|nr:MlaD family protein [Rhodopseudomonas palustris]